MRASFSRFATIRMVCIRYASASMVTIEIGLEAIQTSMEVQEAVASTG